MYNTVFTVDTVRRDASAGVITGLMALPLTIGICLMSEFPIVVGIATVVSACIISFIVSFFRPGNFVGVPGVAAGLAPVLASAVHLFGMENMPILIFITTAFQFVIWHFNLQKFIIRIVPPYLVEGLMAGIGLKIALKFLPNTYLEGARWFSNGQLTLIALSVVSLVVFVWLFQKFRYTKPAIPYVVIVLSSLVLAYYLPVPMLGVDQATIQFAVPAFHTHDPVLIVQLILMAAMLALIDVIEQVMSNVAIERLDPLKRPCDTNNSLLAIWLANGISSFFGGMTNLDGLAKSSTNALAGAYSKLSNLFTAGVLAVFLIFPSWLSHIPYYALAVLMIFTGWKMMMGLLHVAEQGKYPLLLALFCGALVFQLGIFEGLLIVLGLHGAIALVIFKHDHLKIGQILVRFVARFSDGVHPHSTETLAVVADEHTGGNQYVSIRKPVTESKGLSEFIADWAFAVNHRNLLSVVSSYDYNGLLWGTFARELRAGHTNIKTYFEHLLELEALNVCFESSEVRQYKEIYIQSGTYIFSFLSKNKIQKVPARYSFVCKREPTGWYILEHHSSEFPH